MRLRENCSDLVSMNTFFFSIYHSVVNCAGKLLWVWREQCLGLDKGWGGQREQSADGVEVVSWIATVSTDYRKPDGNDSSASQSPGLGIKPKYSALFAFYHTLNYTKLTSV